MDPSTDDCHTVLCSAEMGCDVASDVKDSTRTGVMWFITQCSVGGVVRAERSACCSTADRNVSVGDGGGMSPSSADSRLAPASDCLGCVM